MKTIIYISVTFYSVLLISCGSGGGDDLPTSPSASILLTPVNNLECLVEDAVNFSWNKSTSTDSYEVVIKNLQTSQLETYSSTTNTKQILLSKGTPFSWYVISKSNTSNETAKSAVWKFYLAGKGITNYIPFPAELDFPANGALVNDGSAVLKWTGSDADKDLLVYDVFIDMQNANIRVKENSSENSYTLVNPGAGTYYWKIISIDTSGNKSESDVFDFTIN